MRGEYFDILNEFLNLPLDSGDEIFARFAAMRGAVVATGADLRQRYVYIPGTRKDRVVLVTHMDTVWDVAYGFPFSGERSVEFADGVFYSSNPKCGIGADDRAGCAMLLALCDMGHSLLILDGEEREKRGAKFLKESNPALFKELNEHCFMLALDWRGKDLCLFTQVDNTEKFKKHILKSLGLCEDEKKGGSDLQVLCEKVCGANIGIGYHDFHSTKETLRFSEWENILYKLKDFLAKPQEKIQNQAFFKKHSNG